MYTLNHLVIVPRRSSNKVVMAEPHGGGICVGRGTGGGGGRGGGGGGAAAAAEGWLRHLRRL